MKIKLEKGAKKTEAGNNCVIAESGGFQWDENVAAERECLEGMLRDRDGKILM